MELNNVDGGNRKYILVQYPEPIDSSGQAYKSGFYTIAEICKERIRKANRIISKTRAKTPELFDEPLIKTKIDGGFRSYLLDKSYFKEWQSFTGRDTSQLELRFEQSETPLVEGWKPQNLLAEILLLQGFPLDSKVRSMPEFKANEVQQVTSEFVTHPLYVCLDKKIKPETVSKLKLSSEDIFVCLDSALSDEAKVKLADQCNLKVI